MARTEDVLVGGPGNLNDISSSHTGAGENQLLRTVLLSSHRHYSTHARTHACTQARTHTHR